MKEKNYLQILSPHVLQTCHSTLNLLTGILKSAEWSVNLQIGNNLYDSQITFCRKLAMFDKNTLQIQHCRKFNLKYNEGGGGGTLLVHPLEHRNFLRCIFMLMNK